MVTPTKFTSDEIGAIDDTVKLVVAGQEITQSIGWEIRESVLSQPATWTVRLGHGDTAASLLKLFPPRSPFQLYIGGQLQFTGKTDFRGAMQTDGGGTEIEVGGRDGLAPLHDTYVSAAVNVNVATYAQLVWYALQKVGIVPAGQNTIDPSVLATDNAANRDIKGGVPITAIAPHRTVQQILDDTGLGVSGANVGHVHTTPQARVGETWHHFIRRYVDRAGLMLWATAQGGFVLSAPNGDQKASYLIRRKTGQPLNTAANAISRTFREDTTRRHSEAIVYGRGGGRALGRVKAKGSFVDNEMFDDPPNGFGFKNQPLVVRDKQCHSAVEAAFFARRKLAEERRDGFHLEYTIPGHTLPYLPFGDTTSVRAVVIPDTVVAIEDDQLELDDFFYVETVTRRRSPQTTTTLRLMRIEDLLFATPDESENEG